MISDVIKTAINVQKNFEHVNFTLFNKICNSINYTVFGSIIDTVSKRISKR